jgi:hypothetical protein
MEANSVPGEIVGDTLPVPVVMAGKRNVKLADPARLGVKPCWAKAQVQHTPAAFAPTVASLSPFVYPHDEP